MATSRLKINTTPVATALIELEGMDISMNVRAIVVDMGYGKVHEAFIEYACERIDIDGEFRIVHNCGLNNEPTRGRHET